jgi:2-polyprenyl-6-methoxyphenol hydroxylase-like FAD-dependent oxidoreductase
MSEVIVVGAGPTGLLLAGDLARAGVAVTVLERRAQESNLTRAFAVHARTLEVLDARGLADGLVATGQRVPELRLLGNVRVDLSALPSRFPYVLITPQYETERILTAWALGYGAEIVEGAEVVGVRQDADGVDVDVRVDDTVHTRRAAYVVGTDGVRSTVRAALGLPFPGRSAVRSVMLADVRLSRAPSDVLTVNAAGDAFGFMAPFGDGWYRVIAWSRDDQQPDRAPVTLDEIRPVIARALGTDYGMHEARWMSRFHSDERQVPSYRTGRVLLAGDAAHVHSPAGGQGMNTGLQDAANLGWKLAATLRGTAPDWLLDSYQDERHPVGRMVLRMSGGLLRAGIARRWQLPALRAVAAAASRSPAVRRRAAGQVSGISIGYRRPPGAHPWTGRRAPDLALDDAAASGAEARGAAVERPHTPGNRGRLYEALRDGGFVLVTPGGGAGGVRVARPAAPGPTVLVRPDGYIGWVADAPEPAAVEAAVATWIRRV